MNKLVEGLLEFLSLIAQLTHALSIILEVILIGILNKLLVLL